VASSIQTISIAAAILASTASAPVQCARNPDPEHAIEEDPAEALYGLAEQFRDQGDPGARKSTLLYIRKRYPSSRFADRASHDLQEIGVHIDAGTSP